MFDQKCSLDSIQMLQVVALFYIHNHRLSCDK